MLVQQVSPGEAWKLVEINDRNATELKVFNPDSHLYGLRRPLLGFCVRSGTGRENMAGICSGLGVEDDVRTQVCTTLTLLIISWVQFSLRLLVVV